MSFLRFIGLIIAFALLLTGCSQKISQIEYDRKNYEYEQLKVRYDLLQQEIDSGVKTVSTPKATRVDSTLNIVAYKTLQSKYETLLNENIALENSYNEFRKQQGFSNENSAPSTPSTENETDTELNEKYQALLNSNLALQTAYDELKEAQEVQETPNTVVAPGTVPIASYNELRLEKTEVEKRYVILENRYNALKEASLEHNLSSVETSDMIEPTEINPDQNIGKGVFESEENSIDLGAMVVQSASYNGLFFDFDTYDRTEEYLVLEIAVKNNSQTDLKTFWNTEKIEIVDQDNNLYTAQSFRVGVDYAKEDKGTLLKKIKDDNTVFARFAFEELPQDFNQIKSLQFIVVIDGESQLIKFTQIDISEIEEN